MAKALHPKQLNRLDSQLLEAARQNNRERVRKCLKRGADINCHQENRETALHLAAESGHEKLVRHLLADKKILIDFKTIYGQTPLYMAVQSRQKKVVGILLLSGADVNSTDSLGKTPLHVAVFNKTVDIAKMLIREGARVTTMDVFGDSPLSIAILSKPNPELARLLLRNGAAIEETNPRGIGLLMEAILGATTQSHADAIDMLIRHGTEVNMQDPVGLRTPLHMAAMANNGRVAQLLVNAGANPLARSTFRQTPLELAMMYKHFEAIDILSEQFPEEDYNITIEPQERGLSIDIPTTSDILPGHS